MNHLHLISISILLIICCFVLSNCQENAQFPYPIEASWFADRTTHDEWILAMDNFQSIGGHIVWKRGRTFRTISQDDLENHPDF